MMTFRVISNLRSISKCLFNVPNVNTTFFNGKCSLSTRSLLQAPTVAVVFSGCGVYDGSEIHEATATLASLSRAGADIVCFAPDENQMHVIDHTKGSPHESTTRNVMVESARITRGDIKPLSELTSKVADAVIFPGGFGAAKNLSDFAVSGAEMKVKPDVERVIKDFHEAQKPIGMCCIAPMLAAKVLGSQNVEITLGKPDDGSGNWPYGGSLDAAESLGATIFHKSVDEVCVDSMHRVVTTPAFMFAAKFHQIQDGVAKMVQEVVKMIGQK